MESDLDLFTEDHVFDPYDSLAELRELGPAVYMSRHGYWLLTRYDDVRQALTDWETFTSSEGFGLYEPFNDLIRGTLVATDPPEQRRLRSILSHKLAPRALGDLRSTLEDKARRVIHDALAKDPFDAVADVALAFPIDVLADLVGLPKEGRERLHPGADAITTGIGPMTPQLESRLPTFESYLAFMGSTLGAQAFAEGSWGAELMAAVEAGTLSLDDAFGSLVAYLTAGMDTTVNAIGWLLRLFAERPDVWDAIRRDRSRLAPVFEESLRLESPVQGLFRMTTREVQIGGKLIPERQRVLLHFGAAHRDPRHYPDPNAFQIDRNPYDHMGFGYGVHGCVGQGLTRLEINVLVELLVPHVRRFQLAGPVIQHYHPTMRALDSLPLRVVN